MNIKQMDIAGRWKMATGRQALLNMSCSTGRNDTSSAEMLSRLTFSL